MIQSLQVSMSRLITSVIQDENGSTVKPCNVVTSIKQSLALKGHLSYKILYELNLF